MTTNNLAPVPKLPACRMGWSMEQLLAELSKYAFIMIFNDATTDTWSAKADMRIKTKGATFTVHSGYKHGSAYMALAQLLELVENAVHELGDK